MSSLKPKVILTEDLAKLTLELQVRKDELTLTRDEVAARLANIEQVMKENAMLEQKTREQVAESLELYLDEWQKMKAFYPEVRLGILLKAMEFLTPDDKGKKK